MSLVKLVVEMPGATVSPSQAYVLSMIPRVESTSERRNLSEYQGPSVLISVFIVCLLELLSDAAWKSIYGCDVPVFGDIQLRVLSVKKRIVKGEDICFSFTRHSTPHQPSSISLLLVQDRYHHHRPFLVVNLAYLSPRLAAIQVPIIRSAEA